MGGQLPTQVLAVQLTLNHPEEADCAPHSMIVLLTHPAIGSFLRPCNVVDWSEKAQLLEFREILNVKLALNLKRF